MAKSVAATTVGCKVNSYDTQSVIARFAHAGFEIVDFREFADVYLVNTCCVTNLADKKSRQMIGRAKKLNPRGIVVAFGCAVQGDAKKYADLGVDIVVGTANRSRIIDYVYEFEATQIVDVGDELLSFEAHDGASQSERTRAFLKVQDGCSNFCAYCVIPHVRGPSRSRDFADSVAQAAAFAAAGYKEIVVSGIHVASYGKDLKGRNLVGLLREIAALEGSQRLRLSSVEPMVVDAEFCEFVANEPKFCNHLHLSLQSGSDAILAAMNRKYDTSQYLQAVKALRKVSPEMNFTTDVIAGFPGETDADHAQTLEFLALAGLSKIHVFPYAAKKGTIAAGLPDQVPKAVKTQRVRDLLELSQRLENNYHKKFVGRDMAVLVEDVLPNGRFIGKTTNYLMIEFEGGSEDLCNHIVEVFIQDSAENKLFGSRSPSSRA
ncbi:MAG: tRNA (N(6)-L-threonylcarbamoyladenosine(37)-C(2))-methylthiotransferase MtaB [Defluviitaleaceae bacterium]|nr:tRNA (N(6)-L-threonylcarbamoyladenosine(37)-C(2))-methylthiotransferase MtaB [Defluviitaleaceae bacterium]